MNKEICEKTIYYNKIELRLAKEKEIKEKERELYQRMEKITEKENLLLQKNQL